MSSVLSLSLSMFAVAKVLTSLIQHLMSAHFPLLLLLSNDVR